MSAAPDDPELSRINLLAALAWPHPGFPAPLAGAGFELWGIEREVSTTAGPVRPDVGLVCRHEDHTLLLEVKTVGVDTNQARKLASIRREHYQPSNFTVGDIQKHDHQVGYVMPSERCEDNHAHLAPLADFPIIAADAEADGWMVTLHSGRLTSKGANDTLRKVVRAPHEVPEIVRFSTKTARSKIVADAATSMVSSAYQDGRRVWQISELVESILDRPRGMSRLYHLEVRRYCKNVLCSHLDEAVSHELDGMLRRLDSPSSDPRYDLIFDGANPGGAWLRRFREGVQTLCVRVASGRPPGDQYPLPLDEVDDVAVSLPSLSASSVTEPDQDVSAAE